MSKQLLPIMTENNSFSNLRESGCIYVDKTGYIAKLIAISGKMYFLSRPRRFGKSLTVSTLEAVFQGRRELFNGLAIDALDYDWKKYPIIHIDFTNCWKKTADALDGWLKDRLEEVADAYGVGPLDMTKTSDDLFAKLILPLSKKDKVVVLVDEYDKVVSDNALGENVGELRDTLRGFYQVLKAKGELLRFVFMTGVTKYAKMGVFSGLNNLNDLSLVPAYATMLGYTQKELEENFAGSIGQGIKDTGMGREAYLAKVREMYDGYRFAPGCETVYNPVSVGLFFTNGRGQDFEDYWIETGSSKLVMDMAQSVDLDVTEDLKRGMAKRSLATFDVAELGRMKGDADKVQAFLLQTGYLTIDRADEAKGLYYLRMPNREVEEAYDGSLLERLREKPVEHDLGDMCDALKAGETKRYMEVLASFFAGIPYMDGRKKEADYALVVAALARLMRRQVVAAVEERTSEGRIDLSVVAGEHVYVMEYKVDKSAETALRQIKEKRYADKFRLEKGKTIHLLGIAFSSTGHTVQDWKEEVLA